MPELPDIVVYLDAFERAYVGRTIQGVDLRCPFVVRSFDPDLLSIVGKRIEGVQRLGKRIVWELEDGLYVVFHLMIAGRFHRRKPGAKPRSKSDLIAFHFDGDTIMLTEASKKRRASVHVVSGTHELERHNPRGLEPLQCTLSEFVDVLTSENRTLKRALTDPRKLSGIGNAYSDEILHAAQLSPVKRTHQLSEEERVRLYEATRETLTAWRDLLLKENQNRFPEKVTAFRPQMAVHGKYGEPCPVCQTRVQRIAYADKETNYCPRCQTHGKLLADRSLSRLLKDDWPRTIDELEELDAS